MQKNLLLIILSIFLESFNEGNHFEQLCINYVNEKIQQSFVQLMLRNESDYYAREHLDIPQIPFLDNSCILGTSYIQHKYLSEIQLIYNGCYFQICIII